MGEFSFWERNEADISAIIETIGKLHENTYMWITNLDSDEAWCTAETQEHFGLDRQLYTNFEERIADLAHPYDRSEYTDSIRMLKHGIELDGDFCIRFKDVSGTYALFSIHTDRIKFSSSSTEFFIVILKKYNFL